MNGEENENKKRMMVKIGVWVISVFILLFWALNLRNSFGKPAPADNNLDLIGQEITKTVEEIKETKAEESSAKDKAADILAGLKENIENRQEPQATSSPLTSSSTTEIASSTATNTTPVLPQAPTGCPEYINCMPTIGEVRPCVIPRGCENYTQIAY